MVQATGKVAEYGDSIDKMSQKMGLSAEKYQEWDAIMQHSGTSIEAMKPSMKTLANAAESGSDAFQQLGMSQQEVASMSQEELFEKTIAALQNVEDDTQRTYLAGKLLGKGATELGALLNTSAEDTEKMRQRVHELGGVMSDEAVKASAAYQDSLQDMQTAMDGIKRNAIAEFLPGMTTVMDGLTSIFAGESGGQKKVQEGVDALIKKVEEVVPKFVSVVGKVGSAVLNAVVDNMPTITEKLVQFAVSAIRSMVKGIPKMAETAIGIISSIMNTLMEQLPELLNGLAEGITEGLPIMVEKLMELIETFVAGLGENADGIIDAGINLIMALIEGMTNALPILVEHIPHIIVAIVVAIVENLPKILEAGVMIIGAMIDGMLQMIASIPDIIANTVTEMMEAWLGPDWESVGENILMGIINGIVNAVGDLVNAVVGAVSRAYNSAKEYLGIASPSKLFRDKIGGNIGAGLALGIADSIPMVTQAMDDLDASLVAPYDDSEMYAEAPMDESDAMSSVLTTTTSSGSESGRNVTVVLQLDETQLARTVFRLNNQESQRVGVSLGGAMA
jgi:phage-related protein